MNYEHVLKRIDGTKIKISVRFWVNHQRPEYEVCVTVCGKRKRIYQECFNSDGYKYRALSMEDRRTHAYNEFLKFASEEEINAARIETWNFLKPLKANK
jgi:hypothetical protein